MKIFTVQKRLYTGVILDFLSDCLKSCCEETYLFYNSLDTKPIPKPGSGITAINRDDFHEDSYEQIYPENGRPGRTDSTYSYRNEIFELLIKYHETWEFGELPYDMRYSMPEKIELEKSSSLSARTTDKNLEFNVTVDDLKGESVITIERERGDCIEKTFREKWNPLWQKEIELA